MKVDASRVKVATDDVWARLRTSFPARCWYRFSAIDGKTRALVLAGQAFTSLIPLFILVASLGSHSDKSSGMADNLILRFRLSGSAAQAVRTLFTRPPGATGTLGVVSFVVLFFSLLSLTRALQGLYESAWGFPPQGFRGTLHGLSGTSLIVAEVIVLALLASALRRVPAATFLTLLFGFVLSVGAWLALQWLLLSRRVTWRRLLPTAFIAAGGRLLFSIGSAAYMPQLIQKDAGNYGIIGVTLALISWLIAVALLITAIAVIGAELAGVPPLNEIEVDRTIPGLDQV